MKNISFKPLWRFCVALAVWHLSFANLNAQKYSLKTSPPLAGGNGSSGITFNIIAHDNIVIDSFYTGLYGAANAGNGEIWYNTKPINGFPNGITTANGWVQLGSFTATPKQTSNTAFTPQSTFVNLKLKMKPGDTFGFHIKFTNTVYTTYSSTGPNFTDSRITIMTGTNVGYGASPPSSANHPRQFNGEVFYHRGSMPANNAGVAAITSPSSFCAGNHDVKVDIVNEGFNRLDSVRVNWSIDGTMQNTIYVKTLIDTIGSTNGNKLNVTLGNVNFSGAAKNIRVWTSYPNGVVDTTTSNDTIAATLAPALSGTFTIGGTNPNFATFADAANYLNAYGVCGPVVFNVRPGTYTQRITINNILGSSATNTVKFLGAGTGNTILTYSATATADWATVLLNGTDYVTFQDMDIRATGATYGVAIHLTNNADSNIFRNLNIDAGNTATVATRIGIVISGSQTATGAGAMTGNHNRFDRLVIRGGYYGMHIYGNGTGTGYANGNTITNCEFTEQYYYGVYTYYTNRTVLTNNFVHNMRNTTSYGFYLYYTNADVISNKLESRNAGIYNYYANRYFYTGIRSKIHNNTVYTTNSTYGTYLSTCDNVDYFHNTVVSFYTTSGAAYFTGGTNIDIRNNIFTNLGGGYAIYVGTTAVSGKIDYNAYYTTGSEIAYYGAEFVSLTDWQNDYPALNMNSRVVLPDFVNLNTKDLHITSAKPPFSGDVVDVATDVDGDPRCTFSPTVGADESEFEFPTPILSVSVLDSAFEGSSTRIVSTYSTPYGEKVDVSWYVDGSLVNKTKDLDYSFPSTGTYNIAVKVENCAGFDSVVKAVQVYSPTRTPVTEFVASTTTPSLFEDITLRDISSHGATSWTWTATPADGAVFSDETVANPTVFFMYSGLYDICLTTANSLGQGNTLCKKAYISVGDEIDICNGITESTAPTGRLADDGGLSGNYRANNSCSFVINTCGKINLKFTDFELADAQDELYIYDGGNKQGTLLGKFVGGPGVSLPGGTTGITASTGKMYIEWVSNSTGQGPGFVAFWTTIPDTTITAPTADFSFPSQIYTDNAAVFTSTSQGVNLSYDWDFAPPSRKPGFEGGKKEFDRYSWPQAGNYNVRLRVSNCVASDEVTKQVTVIDPTSAPVVNFYTDRLRVPVLSKLRLYDSSSQGPNAWQWEITPSNKVKFETSANVQNPGIYFTAPGFYTVKLKATNSFGTDSLVKTNYIEVYSYCLPAVGALNTDMGISRVKFGNIDNHSASGVGGYTSYYENMTPYKVIRKTSFNITVERPANMQDDQNRKIWVDWNGDADFDDAGEEVASEAAAKTVSWTATIQVPATANVGPTVMRIGTSYKSSPNSPCGVNSSGEFEDYPLMISLDDILPVITRSGVDTAWVEQWHSYIDPGAIANDNVDGNLTASIVTTSNFDSSQTGTYYIRYNVKDVEGNDAAEVVRVVVVTPDMTAPEITLLGNATENVTVSTAYTDAGATASDYLNRDISGAIQVTDNINMAALGTYYVIYTVNDGAGNKDSVVRTVNVIDDIDPSITLNGTDPYIMEVNTDFNDPGYTLIDNFYDPATLASTVDSSALNKNKTGTYTVIYTATDNSGNTATRSRQVIVRDTKLPVITLIANDTLIVDVFTHFYDPGVTVSDNYCTNNNWSVDQYPNTNIIKDYELTYNATDCEGNAAIAVKRLVRVVDRKAPEIELIGFPTVAVPRWSAYTDSGYNVSDNYYATAVLQPMVQTTSNVNTLWPGTYSVCYQVTDPSGNKSTKVCRIVTVEEATGSIVKNDLETRLKVYPNPNNGRFTVALDGGFTQGTVIEVLDMLGKVVETVPATGENMNIAIDHLGQGIYFVKVSEGDQNAIVKVSVVK